MSEFVRRSRKNEMDTRNFEVEKLQKPDEGKSLESLEPEVRDKRPERLLNTLPRLPWQLERLLSAASLNEPLSADVQGVFDVNRYVLAWGCSYLTVDQGEALKRLWRVYSQWDKTN